MPKRTRVAQRGDAGAAAASAERNGGNPSHSAGDKSASQRRKAASRRASAPTAAATPSAAATAAIPAPARTAKSTLRARIRTRSSSTNAAAAAAAAATTEVPRTSPSASSKALDGSTGAAGGSSSGISRRNLKRSASARARSARASAREHHLNENGPMSSDEAGHVTMQIPASKRQRTRRYGTEARAAAAPRQNGRRALEEDPMFFDSVGLANAPGQQPDNFINNDNASTEASYCESDVPTRAGRGARPATSASGPSSTAGISANRSHGAVIAETRAASASRSRVAASMPTGSPSITRTPLPQQRATGSSMGAAGEHGGRQLASPNFLKGFEEKLTCPICCDPFYGSVFQCSNGHLLCSECRDRLSPRRCPSCREEMKDGTPGVRNRTLEALALEFYAGRTFSCKYHPCTITSMWNKVRHHRKHCEFRPFSCYVMSCPWEGPWNEWCVHHAVKHGGYVEGTKLVTQLPEPRQSGRAGDDIFTWLIHAHERWFMFIVRRPLGGGFLAWIRHTGDEVAEVNYRISTCSHEFRWQAWTGVTYGVQSEKDEEERREDCFEMSDHLTRWFHDGHAKRNERIHLFIEIFPAKLVCPLAAPISRNFLDIEENKVQMAANSHMALTLPGTLAAKSAARAEAAESQRAKEARAGAASAADNSGNNTLVAHGEAATEPIE